MSFLLSALRAQHHPNTAVIRNCEAMCSPSEVGISGREKLTGGDALSSGQQNSAARPRTIGALAVQACGSHTDATACLVPEEKRT